MIGGVERRSWEELAVERSGGEVVADVDGRGEIFEC
jgi:hypothetical protein